MITTPVNPGLQPEASLAMVHDLERRVCHDGREQL